MDGESDDLTNVSYFSFSEREACFSSDSLRDCYMRVFNGGRGKFVYISHVCKLFVYLLVEWLSINNSLNGSHLSQLISFVANTVEPLHNGHEGHRKMAVEEKWLL